MTQKPKRRGRPPGTKFPHLLHIRIDDEMLRDLEEIIDERRDRPSITALVRESLAHLVDDHKRKQQVDAR